MTSRTEARLRDATTALGQSVQPGDLPELRLPGVAEGRRWRLPGLISGGGRPAIRFVVPLAAAGTMLALLAGLIVGGRLLRSTGHSPAPAHHSRSLPAPSPTGRPAPTPSPSLSTVPGHALHGRPRYLVTSVEAHGAVRSTATGKLVARITSPERNFLIDGVTTAPGDRTFYLAGEVPITSAGRAWIDFYRVPLGADGHPGPAQLLPGERLNVPLPMTSDALMQLPLAISPDGTELAYPSDNQFYPDDYAARHPATITVQDVSTGSRRTWDIWPAADTQISGVSWASGGRLGIVATVGDAAVVRGRLRRTPGTDAHVFLMLNTEVGGSSLAADSTVVAFSSYHAVHHGLVTSVTTGPTGGVISPDGTSAYLQIGVAHGAANLAQVDVATGKVMRVLLTRPAQPTRASPLAIDGRYLLVALGPVAAPKPGALYVCGRLTALNLATGNLSQLPFPIQCSTAAPPPPLQVAW